jgi:hypothetical protein
MLTEYFNSGLNVFMYYPDSEPWKWNKTVKRFNTWTNDFVDIENVPITYKAQLLLLT